MFWAGFFRNIGVIFKEKSYEDPPGEARGTTLRDVVTASLAAELIMLKHLIELLYPLLLHL